VDCFGAVANPLRGGRRNPRPAAATPIKPLRRAPHNNAADAERGESAVLRVAIETEMLPTLDLEDRIAAVRENIRQLVEQAAVFSGAGDEERTADRIAQQTEELERLIAQQEALLQPTRFQ
jgi:hypothetical protein